MVSNRSHDLVFFVKRGNLTIAIKSTIANCDLAILIILGAGEIAQWLKGLVALLKDPSSIPSINMVVHNYL